MIINMIIRLVCFGLIIHICRQSEWNEIWMVPLGIFILHSKMSDIIVQLRKSNVD